MKVLVKSKKKALLKLLLVNKQRQRRKYWVHPINKLRNQLGDAVKIDLKFHEFPDRFRKDTRFTPEQFEELLLMLESKLQKDNSRRESISPRVRLYVTLRYLAHGVSMQMLSSSFCMGHSTVSNIISETTRLIWDTLSPVFMPQPDVNDWEVIANDFERYWQYPNCIGALDGKHVLLQCPHKSGSLYFNYKNLFSMNLMAMCDAHYRFIMIDVGGFGRQNDAGVFRECPFGKRVLNGTMNFPQQRFLSGSTLPFPFVIVADDAFPMSENILKPFPGNNLDEMQRIYNYRHSRARRTIENTFGIMASRFRIFRTPIIGKTENVDFIVKACCVLHNFLRTWDMKNGSSSFFSEESIDREDTVRHAFIRGDWRKRRCAALQPMGKVGSNNYAKKVKLMRQNMAMHFVKNLTVPWQENYVRFTDWNPVQ